MTTEQSFATAPTLAPGRYRMDPATTVVRFSARKFGMFTIRGTMQLIDGEFIVADPIAISSVKARLATDSFSTPMAKRDEHVKDKKLLDVATFPTIDFTGTHVRQLSGELSVGGTLRIHGQERPAELTIQEALEHDGVVLVRASAQIDRNDFGVTGMKVAAGPKIDLQIEASARRV